MGFENEKDHPEVAPSQFEINYGYGEVVAAADQIQLYKLICRQVATGMGCSASFLPKPVVGVNGNGMHTNVSISKDGKNLCWDPEGEEKLSPLAWSFVDRILSSANDICLLLNASVNAYRRLDPHFEAPNQIKASPIDRGSMVRMPLGNEKSSRIEVRSVGPDANPYLVLYSIFSTGIEGEIVEDQRPAPGQALSARQRVHGIDDFRRSKWTTNLLGEDVKGRYADLKQASADRCPRLLGSLLRCPKCNSTTMCTTSSCGTSSELSATLEDRKPPGDKAIKLLGIDVGTGGTRALLIDESGAVVASAIHEHQPFASPRSGWAEQDPQDWWNACQGAVRKLLGESAVPAAQIACIGLSGQMHGAVLLDRNNEVLRPALIWCDQRTAAECRYLNDTVGPRRSG